MYNYVDVDKEYESEIVIINTDGDTYFNASTLDFHPDVNYPLLF